MVAHVRRGKLAVQGEPCENELRDLDCTSTVVLNVERQNRQQQAETNSVEQLQPNERVDRPIHRIGPALNSWDT